MGSGVVVAFFFGWPNYILGNVTVDTVPVKGLKGFFHYAVFPRMEGQHCCPAPWPKRTWQLGHEVIKHLVFVVNVNAQGLEDSGTGFFNQLVLILALVNLNTFKGLYYLLMQLDSGFYRNMAL